MTLKKVMKKIMKMMMNFRMNIKVFLYFIDSFENDDNY